MSESRDATVPDLTARGPDHPLTHLTPSGPPRLPEPVALGLPTALADHPRYRILRLLGEGGSAWPGSRTPPRRHSRCPPAVRATLLT
jgi:hypothetical protein